MYAVLRVAKLKTMGEIGQLGKHNERTRETRNADEARLGDNVRLAGTGDWCADAQARLDDAPTIRSNAVLGMEHVLTASREFYHQGDERARAARLDDWTARSMAWLRDTYGEKNVVAAVLHKDEQTPHVQALVVPIDERGRLNAHAYTAGRAMLARMQDSYAAAVRDLGLERGVKGSVADHQTVREFYAKIMEPTPAPEIVKRHLEVERTGRLVGNPERWAAEQTARIAERIAPALDAALVKAQHYEGQAATAEANVAVLQQRVREVERERDTLQRDYKALVAQVRGIALEDTMRALGGVQDRHDTHKWQVAGEHISINGEKFYNHDRQSGGGQSIDLVMHVGGYTFRQAVAYLNRAGGPELPWRRPHSTARDRDRRSSSANGASRRASSRRRGTRGGGRRSTPTSSSSGVFRAEWSTSCTNGARCTRIAAPTPFFCARTRRGRPWARAYAARCRARSSRGLPWAAGAARGTSRSAWGSQPRTASRSTTSRRAPSTP